MKNWFGFILIYNLFFSGNLWSQTSMINIPGRHTISLNGEWKVIIDQNDVGISDWTAIWKDKVPKSTADFVEYSFENGPVLKVPGDFNSQLPELNLYESTVWYKKSFDYHKSDKRLFIHFGAVNYMCDVVLNGEKIGHHEGGFTPFQFEITGKVKEGTNAVLVRANSQRLKNGVPALGFDWFNYGGITRDVNLVETPAVFIEDYFIQLQKGSNNQIQGWVKIDGANKAQQVRVQIPEAKIDYKVSANETGFANIQLPAKLALWSPEQPKLYNVIISSGADTISESIGFRNIEVKGTDILVNGKPVFLKGVNFHEEAPQRRARAYSEADAFQMLTWAKELGCNFVRMAHYPHNENEVRLADKMGLMIWEEIPVYQGIAFSDTAMQAKMNWMVKEMVQRDKNRCAVIIWSMSNETSPGKDRDANIAKMADLTRALDPTRLVSSAFNQIKFEGSTATINDTLSKALDVIAVNEYLGWYRPWPSTPGTMTWVSDFNKPLIMSEFGAEALYGNHGLADSASAWREEYQEQVYKDQVAMFKTIPFLKGTCPWILVDFRSPVRMHPVYQNGYNRKGLLNENGKKKKAWFVMKNFYDEMN
ncbi:MAG: glycoside hydrolase family 2 TIM barrel-domain containing protein [Ferruginibacter sp.]